VDVIVIAVGATVVNIGSIDVIVIVASGSFN